MSPPVALRLVADYDEPDISDEAARRIEAALSVVDTNLTALRASLGGHHGSARRNPAATG